MDRIKDKLKSLNETKSKDINVDADLLQNCGLKNITLRSYQVDGIQWLVERYIRGHGSILGDEMGLGKTCQTISMLVYLYGSGKSKGPFLILSPLSVMANWQNELARFAPKLNVCIYNGAKEVREEIQFKLKKNKSSLCVLLTTYEICLKDERFLRRFSWHTLVVDEAHRLKNRQSLLHQTLLDFNIEHRLLLTGTPVQNNLKELYSLLCFVAPDIFKEKYMEEFVGHFNDLNENSTKDTKELHNLLKPFLLRRIKSEVIKDLPKKSEVVLFHGMTKLQKKYYKAILLKDTSVFETGCQTSRTQLMNILMQLRKCVNHPYLFDGVEPEPFVLGEHLVEASGKLLLIDQLLSHLRPAGHKVLLFSQMTRMLDILQDYLAFRGYNYERLDGSVRGEERYLAVSNFNSDSSTFVFLLSTRAGGVGLNLTAADTVIFVDSDFNPQNDLQAAARAHRIGQTRPVKIIRLIGSSTVEEIILRRAEAKLQLTNSVIEGGQFSLGTGGSKDAAGDRLIADSNVQLSDILKFGVDRLLSTEDSSVEDVDFEDILGRSEHGQWLEDEQSKTQQASLASASMDAAEVGESAAAAGESMYMFEGTDYSKEPSAEDEKAFEEMLEAAKALASVPVTATGRTKRAAAGAGLLPGLPADVSSRGPRTPLTAEQLEQRRKRREELAARREEEAKQAAARKQKKLEALWKANNYVSLSIHLSDDEEDDDSDESQDDDDGDDEDGGKADRGLHYVVGDVTNPQHTADRDAIVIHCVDDSGGWGSGGVFSALSRRSDQPENHYELCHKMKDLHLGDAHMIPIDDKKSRAVGKDYCMLLVVQHRDRRNNLSGIQLSQLQTGLAKVYKAAKQHKASVHLARIGHNTPNFNWYGTERLLRKELAARGIPTYIYYFPRKQQKKRAATPDGDSSGEEQPAKVARRTSSESPSVDPQPGTSKTSNIHLIKGSKKSVKLMPLPNFMKGVDVYFHKDLLENEVAQLKRYLIAFDGDVSVSVTSDTTHIIVPDDMADMQSVIALCHLNSCVVPVTAKWLRTCFSTQHLVDHEPYRVDQ